MLRPAAAAAQAERPPAGTALALQPCACAIARIVCALCMRWICCYQAQKRGPAKIDGDKKATTRGERFSPLCCCLAIDDRLRCCGAGCKRNTGSAQVAVIAVTARGGRCHRLLLAV